MSAISIITPFSVFNEKENNTFSNHQSYNDLIDYCSIRKQFTRIFPNYYRDYESQAIPRNKKHISNQEEFKKLKQEIISMENSIIILEEKKQKKLSQIEELRNLMKKEGIKKLMHINNKKNDNNNYREKNNKQCLPKESKTSNGIKLSCDETEEGLSNPPLSSSGKDDDAGNDEEDYQDGHNFGNNFNFNNSRCWCFSEEKEEEKRLDLKHEKNLMLHKNN